ncbi:hypothetical protein [Arundinibacter roseus]|uniref:Glycine zipper 2TM domain-containing protein n=1 Tax=Arundinibacter roseus TaxID=2070510 RepID=A0A4R4KHR8_9BACT|nr:hypothetical protein [Arundinibacter roseus]TDB67323.1 hypothetical protein EZE20_05070 [Arundinibacter roseus]
MKQDEEIVNTLIKGGIIGAALGALVSENKENGATIGALAGAALLATFRANQHALQNNLPMFLEENNVLYEIKADGSKHFVRNLAKTNPLLPEHFKLK